MDSSLQVVRVARIFGSWWQVPTVLHREIAFEVPLVGRPVFWLSKYSTLIWFHNVPYQN
jgi:hypothetical protein